MPMGNPGHYLQIVKNLSETFVVINQNETFFEISLNELNSFKNKT